jgi:alcohol dehydrogenase
VLSSGAAGVHDVALATGGFAATDLRSAAGSWRAQIGAVEVHFGAGALAALGEVVRAAAGPEVERVLLVTDPGVRRAGHAEAAAAALAGAGLAADLFDAVGENPTTAQVAAGAAFAAPRAPGAIVAVGGGSAMDCAKGINFLLTNGGRMEDYEGRDRAIRPMLPSVGVPTTAGTGSEAQRFALIARAEDHRKMACGDAGARFRAVVLDPALAATAPRRVAAAAGLDAVSHALESAVTAAGNPVSRMLAREAWRLLDGALPAVLSAPEELAAVGRALLGAHLAGAAIEQSMLGAAHACANPLTARFGVAHGVAVALMLPHVVRFNAAAAADVYGELAAAAGLAGADAGADPAATLARRVESLRAGAGLPGRLADCGVPAVALPALAAEATTQWTGRFNPRPVTEADFLRLYESAL